MEKYKIYNCDCFDNWNTDILFDAIITDPPYGINMFGEKWDKTIPSVDMWKHIFSQLKPGGYALIFSSIKLLHRMACNVEDSGMSIKDILMWGQLNNMPKNRNVGLEIDKTLNIDSDIIGEYKYSQGYKNGADITYKNKESKKKLSPASELGKKYNGYGYNLKPAYEPIILAQKPFDGNLTNNIIKHGVGGLNLEETRIPYDINEKPAGHNPHPLGRVASNIIRTDVFNDDYDKFFVIPKVRQDKDDFNTHPTVKPVNLMSHLIKLVTLENQLIYDPFMGSGSTGIACIKNNRIFYGTELDTNYFNIAKQRLNNI